MSLSFRRVWVRPDNPLERDVDGIATFTVSPQMVGSDSAWLIQNVWTDLSGDADLVLERAKV